MPYSSGDALYFSSALASLEQGHRIQKPLSQSWEMGIPAVVALQHECPLRMNGIISMEVKAH